MDFANGYFTALMSVPGNWTLNQSQMAQAMQTHPLRTKLALSVIEREVRHEYGISLAAQIDWGPATIAAQKKDGTATTINWQAILAFIEQIWSFLAPFLPFLNPTPTPAS